MLRSLKDIQGYRIHATDGHIGSVHTFLFDDINWVIQYIVVDTGDWIPGKKVLLTPAFVDEAKAGVKELFVKLNKQQIEDSPHLDTHKPVSRQQKIQFHSQYGWAAYAEPVGPLNINEQQLFQPARDGRKPAGSGGDRHLRSLREVLGYHIRAADGDVGHVEDLIFESGSSWAIRYMAVDTRNWLPGKKVLVSPDWIKTITWSESRIHVDLTREAVKNCPPYDPNAPVNREYEARLYDYYGRPKYWM